MYKSEWNIMEKLETMLTGKKLKEKMMVIPAYDKNIRNESQAVRLMHLNDLNTFYLPSDMSVEIYTKICKLSCCMEDQRADLPYKIIGKGDKDI